MSTFASLFSSNVNSPTAWSQATQADIELKHIPANEFERKFECKLLPMPLNVCAIGWSAIDGWIYSASAKISNNIADHRSRIFQSGGTKELTRFLSTQVFPKIPLSRIWFPYCFYDAWRERHVFSNEYRWVTPGRDTVDAIEWRSEAGCIPLLSTTHYWVACFGAHRGDPSAYLMPDGHFFLRGYYKSLFGEIESIRVPWSDKIGRVILAAGDHGENVNFFVPSLTDLTDHPRRRFRSVAKNQKLAADVFLGQRVSYQDQLRYKFIADVDGYARTWSAWAWKMMSGSTVLSVESPWASYFTDQFEAWHHFVPIANDCSDLGEKLAWCQKNDDECREIAARARIRALEVYDPSIVATRVSDRLSKQLLRAPPSEWIHAVSEHNAGSSR